MSSPTQRALAECKRRGWTAQVVERWNQWAKVRQDLFGVIDIVAITPMGILGIQCTDATSHSKRRTKILGESRAHQWVSAGGQFELWSFAKRGDRGKRKLWTLRAETFAEMRDAVAETALVVCRNCHEDLHRETPELSLLEAARAS